MGRFAPSPTGPLHAGSIVAALASWLDARSQGGIWRVRIEDTDTPRCSPAATDTILQQLQDLGLVADGPVARQSAHTHRYETALQTLLVAQAAYACGCSRREIEEAVPARHEGATRFAPRAYPGTCRRGLAGKAPRSIRLMTCDATGGDQIVTWEDRRLGAQQQNVTQEVGDFVLRRADGLWAYQLAVVVDDAAQGVTHIVRGEDLADNTPRQILLQSALRLPTPCYLHTPLVLAEDGLKLSKQNGAAPVLCKTRQEAVNTLQQAAQTLGLRELPDHPLNTSAWLEAAVRAWSVRYPPSPGGMMHAVRTS